MSEERREAPESPMTRALGIAGAVAAVLGAVASTAQILDYAESLPSKVWIGVGVVLTIAPILVVVIVLVLQRAWRRLGVASLVLILVAGGASILSWQIGSGSRPYCSGEDRDDGSDRYRYPMRLDNAEDVDLEYCRVDVNEGRPLERQYTLRGKVVGVVPDGRVVLLIVQPDPGSCDALGQRGSGNYYLRQEIRFDGRSAAWDRSDAFFYPEAITLKHNYYYVIADDEALAEMRRHAEIHTRNGRYHGMERLPEPSELLASFSIQGSTDKAKPCR